MSDQEEPTGAHNSSGEEEEEACSSTTVKAGVKRRAPPSKKWGSKKKSVRALAPRFVDSKTVKDNRIFSQRKHVYASKYCMRGELPEGLGQMLVYTMIRCTEEGLYMSLCTEGYPVLILAKPRQIDEEEYAALPEEDQFYCIRSMSDEIWYMEPDQRECHLMLASEKAVRFRVFWAAPAHVVKLAPELPVEEERDPVNKAVIPEDDRRDPSNCSWLLMEQKQAAAFSKVMLETYDVVNPCTVWLRTHRDIPAGGELLLERAISLAPPLLSTYVHAATKRTTKDLSEEVVNRIRREAREQMEGMPVADHFARDDVSFNASMLDEDTFNANVHKLLDKHFDSLHMAKMSEPPRRAFVPPPGMGKGGMTLARAAEARAQAAAAEAEAAAKLKVSAASDGDTLEKEEQRRLMEMRLDEQKVRLEEQKVEIEMRQLEKLIQMASTLGEAGRARMEATVEAKMTKLMERMNEQA